MGIGLVLVLAVSVAVGLLVYRLTDGGEQSPETEPETEEVPADRSGAISEDAQDERLPEAPEGYIPVGSNATSWSARLGGAMGLVIAVAVGAIVLALSLWFLVTLVGRLMSGATSATA